MRIVSARYSNADHSAAEILTEEFGLVLISAADRPAAWAAMLAGDASITAYEPPLMVRSAFGADLFGVLTKAEHAMLAGARADDLRIITARGQDMIPETNAKLARLAAVAGLSVADWFGRLP